MQQADAQQRQLVAAMAESVQAKTLEARERRTSQRLARQRDLNVATRAPAPAQAPRVQPGPLLQRTPISPLCGDGSECGPDDKPLAPLASPPRQSRLILPGSSGGYEEFEYHAQSGAHGEIRDMKAGLEIQHSHANNVAILERARSRYPMTWEASASTWLAGSRAARSTPCPSPLSQRWRKPNGSRRSPAPLSG